MNTATEKASQEATTKMPLGEKIASILIVAIIVYLFIAK
jgi:hypothetical protein